jgi:hypothetical protein
MATFSLTTGNRRFLVDQKTKPGQRKSTVLYADDRELRVCHVSSLVTEQISVRVLFPFSGVCWVGGSEERIGFH